MLETISNGFRKAKEILRSETILSEEVLNSALKEVRLSLLEADVEYSVVKNFLARVKESALGKSIQTSVTDKKGKKHKLSAQEHFIGICYEELEALMAPGFEDLEIKKPITSFMMVGLQGSGKTTSSAKLARYLKEEKNLKPLLVAADIYRPGAANQLEILGDRLGVNVFHKEGESAQEICRQGLEYAKENNFNALIYDTAGRLAIDEALMQELDDIKSLCDPNNIFLVVDAMIGQDAVNTASQFNERLSIDGFIMTKLDGDARGGAALSIKEVTKKPILFLGMGEDLNSLEPFRPQGLASRILGMGDVVSLAKDFEKHVDEKEAEQDVKRMMRGQFSFDDFIKQLKLMRKMGSFQSIMERIPFLSEMLPSKAAVDEREFGKFEAMISSMTKKERSNPGLLSAQRSRRERVAKGSGRPIKELDQLIERFSMMQKMMQMVGKNPSALMNHPLMKNMGRASNISSKYGNMGNPMGGMDFSDLGGGPSFGMPGALGQAPSAQKPKMGTKEKKDKRKQQKLARKKNKKRK